MTGLSHLAAKLSGVSQFKNFDFSVLGSIPCRDLIFEKGDSLARSGKPQWHTFLLSSGWVVCYRWLPTGQRQVIDLRMPGDFVCLEAAPNGVSNYCIDAATTVSAMAFGPHCIVDLIDCSKKLRDVTLWQLAQEKSILSERLASIGRRTAHERMVHFLLEFWYRQLHSANCSGAMYKFPISLETIADALGLSHVHSSRTLKTLRDEQLINVDFALHTVRIVDERRAAAVCEFNADYLLWDKGILSAVKDHTISA